jgi:phospholipase D1/2
MDGVLKAGSNCWTISTASRATVLIDAKEYFQTIAWAAERAKKSIFFLSWDIDSRISLLPEESGEASLPLGDFLLRLVEKNPELHIYILTWDFVFFYADERESKNRARERFSRHPRIHFEFDKTGPVLVSHHQKVVVVDDQLAFAGGLDVTQRRWDTSDHRIDKPLRVDPGGEKYEPFHDVQMMVEGEPARELGDLCRQRWFKRTGQHLPAPSQDDFGDLWPRSIRPLFANHAVAIARTVPEYKDDKAVRECEALFYDAIKNAKDYIFVENQYFTSKHIGDAIIERLKDPHGPEIVILVRLHNSKWTEAVSVAVLRARLLRRLKRYDKWGRLSVLCPYASVSRDICLNLHSKVFIADDTFLRIGSSNLCGRSIAMDTECDLALEVSNEEGRGAIRWIRNRLLAEHLDVTESEIGSEISSTGSLISGIRRFQDKSDRTLKECPDKAHFLMEWLVPSAALVDPETPDQFKRGVTRSIFYAAVLILLIFLVPTVRENVNRETVMAWARWVQELPFALGWLTALFFGLTLIGAPLLPLAVGFALVLPPIDTFVCTMAGSMMSATAVYFFSKYWVGKSTGGFFSRLLENERFIQIQQLLEKEGLWPVVLIRLAPIAPYWIANFCMGVMGIRFWQFLASTFLGLLPGFVMLAYFEDKVASRGNLNALVVAVMIFVIVGWALQKGVRHLVDRRELNVNGG